MNSNISENSLLNNSFFMRSINEIKKEKSLNFYNEKIFPNLIKNIQNEIDLNYNKIINNLKQPFLQSEKNIMNGILLKEEIYINKSKPVFINEKEINELNKNFIDKEKILNDFSETNKNFRIENNIINESYYDNMLNECVIDATNEIISNERNYKKCGKPLKFSTRTIENEKFFEKNYFIKDTIRKLKNLNRLKMGLISENYDYLDNDQINNDRDRKFYYSIKKELKENDDEYKNYEKEETQIKLILSKIIFDQLLNELVEILEHVMYSRRDQKKYQSKSIYACEDIPRLSFQNTTENNFDNTDSINQ
jgi:hypothetical protein